MYDFIVEISNNYEWTNSSEVLGMYFLIIPVPKQHVYIKHK